MKYFVVVVVAALFSIASAVNLDWRIVGGQTAEDGQFPYQVALKQFRFLHCGGSILNKNFVLTAAHCVYNSLTYSYKIHVGSNKHSSPQKIYKVERVIRHEKFVEGGFHDIALLKLTEPIQFNDKVQPIQLETSFLDVGVDLIVSGWGMISYPGDAPEDLQFIHLKSINTEDCSKRFSPINITVDDSQICTLTQKGEGVCQGDSGGPLVHNGKLAGVVSFGEPCAIGYPDVFTRVSEYIDWINENMK